ncbi:acyltransferase [Evansella sp. AB-P1]|uniref:acyltransferase family protein n=1 Tax=Evansella sp. AB-P1 TaxID=3037653 RepID=UPI00241DE0CA|nr:acyltransferase [Evansella sp. AB-P1]MDG5787883.1 acyltransferase [Evansella sp. AB-P1]
MERQQKGMRLSYVHLSRGVAIILIVIGHLNLLFFNQFSYNWFGMGRWERTGGVDYFFLITGFMIYYVYHKDLGVKGKAKEFFIKRMIKIYPLYWIFTIITLLLMVTIPMWYNNYSFEVLLKSLLLLPTDPIIIPEAWSLPHIMFFYIMFGCLLFSPKIIKPFIAIWAIATIFIGLNIIPSQGYFLFSFSSLEVFIGMLLCYVVLHFKLKYSTFMIVIGIIGFVIGWLNNVYGFIPVPEPFIFALFSMFILVGLAVKDEKERKIPKVLSFLGDASYSIYISHSVFLQLYTYVFYELNLIYLFGYFLSMCIILIFTITSSSIVYIFMEKPISKKLKKLFAQENSKKKTPNSKGIA